MIKLMNDIIIKMKQQNQLIFQDRWQESNIQKKASQHLQDYQNYFKDINDGLLSRNQLIEQLHSNGNIKYTDCNEDQYFKISVINYTSTFQIINIQVQYGHFLIPITIYNVQENSLSHYIETISSSVANIYAYQEGAKEEAIKCFLIKKQAFEESFIGAIKEYCIFKIAATLNIGPNLSKLCGFDLIVFSECIEFCMEKGLSLNNIDKIQNSRGKFKNLKRNLRIMHELNIVHMDIKPTNICLNQRHGHLLFIDFGFSNIIFEQIGFKSLVCFFGSLNYCCPQMLNTYNTGESQLVDLYYNDVFALKKVEKQILAMEKEDDGSSSKYELYQLSYEQKFTFRIYHKLHQFFKLARLKYLFFSASPLIKSKEIMDIFLSSKKSLIKFTKTMPYSRLLEQFYDLLSKRSKDAYNEVVLKNTLQNFISISNSDDGVESTPPEVIQRYSATLMGIHIKRRDIMNVNLNYIKEIGLKEMVSSPHIVKDLKKSVYYEKYVLFVNFKVRLSTFQQKIDAAKVMCQVLGITPSKSEFYDMEVSYLITSLRFLMQFYLAEDDRISIKSLPIILGNLIILEELSESEIVQIIAKVFNKKLSVSDYTNISIKLFLSLYWVLEQSSSRYQMRKLTGACANTILKYLGEIKTESECQKNHIKAIKLFLFLDYGAATTKKFQIIEAFIEQKVPFIDKQIKRQIMIYLKTITMKLYFNGENRDKIINCIKLISEQENVVKYEHLQYYHFKIFYFFFYTNNIRGMESIIKKFQACLGSPILTSKYYISDLYQHQIYIYRNKNNRLFYQQLLNIIQDDPKDTNKRIVFKIFHPYRLTNIDYNALDIENKALLSNIHALLRETFPLEALLHFDQTYKRYGGYVKNFGQWCYNYVNIIGSIYPRDEFTLMCLKRFEEKLKILPSSMSCYCCRQRFQSCFLIVSTYRLQLEGRFQEIIKMYQQYAFKETLLNQDQFKLLAIMDILRFTIMVPSLNHRIEESVVLFCQWMTKRDAWFQSFNIIAKPTKAFQVINRFFFMREQFVEYFKIQEKFLESILQYPTKQYIISYCSSHIQFLSKFSVSQEVIVEQLKVLKVVEKNRNPYFCLLASIVLIFCSLIDATFPNKIICYIYANISKIITFAKCITRGHLFYYLAKHSAHLLSNHSQFKQQKQRKLLFKIKMYIKSSIHDLTFSEFKKNYANGKKIKSKCESINNFIQIKLSKYYSLIKRNKDEDYNLLNFSYPSPFWI